MQVAKDYLDYVNSNILAKPDTTRAPTKGGMAVQVFVNTDLRYQHKGLARLAAEFGINVNALEQGQYVLFINGAQNKMKVYGPNHVMAYHRLPSGKLTMEGLQTIWRAFRSDGKLQLNQTLLTELNKTLKTDSATVDEDDLEPTAPARRTTWGPTQPRPPVMRRDNTTGTRIRT